MNETFLIDIFLKIIIIYGVVKGFIAGYKKLGEKKR